MNAAGLDLRYNNLENDVILFLMNKIKNSKHTSKHMDEKVIKVNVFDYDELAIVNDKLTFLNRSGHHYNLYAECSLEDLINIISTVK